MSEDNEINKEFTQKVRTVVVTATALATDPSDLASILVCAYTESLYGHWNREGATLDQLERTAIKSVETAFDQARVWEQEKQEKREHNN